MSEKNTLIHKIDSWLWQRGYRLKGIRVILRFLLLFNALAFIIALISLAFTNIPLSFALASLLASVSFFEMTRNIVRHFPRGGTKKVTLGSLFSFFLRMAIVLALSLGAILILSLPPIPWFLGLGIPIVVTPMGFVIKD